MSPITGIIARLVTLVGAAGGASLSHSSLQTSEPLPGSGGGPDRRGRSGLGRGSRDQIRPGNAPRQACQRGSARGGNRRGLRGLPALVRRRGPAPGRRALGPAAGNVDGGPSAAEPVRLDGLEDGEPVLLAERT